ncbi:NADH-quinone oxidoreductase subunit N [Caulifigura coniformis]|uniref:NADH-quinone oxidoreductase subunit N n=1 Tax=Caulifigura coniformis TaxID=2527983 RepID=A0A517SFV3_9PLAN|nr:NADH-quinone oxidoreductase subunit N [Caulifigura coniformis]QDT55015.1 NADH-quinone oxidoreductase subunit N [Caulifigura coniformis]
MDIESLQAAYKLILPEAVLIGTACVMFLAAPFLTPSNGKAAEGSRHKWGFLSVFAVAFACYLMGGTEISEAASGPFLIDGLAWTVRGVSLVLGAILILIAWNQVDDSVAAECHACLLMILAGVNITAASNDLISLFLGLELVSIPTYVLLYLPKRSPAAQEATVKYFLLSVFSSGMLLYGFAMAYGATGSTSLVTVQRALGEATTASSPFLLLAVPFVIAGLGFRITAVPFHFYAPDVFQGSPTFMAALLSFVPKVVGFTALWRLTFLPALPPAALLPGSWMSFWQMMLAAFAVLTMFVGNLMALRQTNLHRLLAYSSVAQAGYMMSGLVAGWGDAGATPGGAALLFYLIAYGAMTIGAFAILLAAARSGESIKTSDELAGLSSTSPMAAFLLAFFLLSLAGLPPTAGFLGKFNLFLALWSNATTTGYWVSIFMMINAAIAAWYYLRLIGVMYLQPATGPELPPRPNLPAWVAGSLCAVATLGLFVAGQSVWDAALAAVR